MNVTIIGTGYVGLITGVCLAYKGHSVNCYDINKKIINSINNGVPPIYEQNLEKYFDNLPVIFVRDSRSYVLLHTTTLCNVLRKKYFNFS